MVDHLAVGPTAQTGSELLRLRALIAFLPDDPVSFDMQPEGAAAPAVEGGNRAWILAGVLENPVSRR